MPVKIHLKCFYKKEKQIMTLTNKWMELENSESLEVNIIYLLSFVGINFKFLGVMFHLECL